MSTYIKIQKLKTLDREHLLHGEKIVALVGNRREILTVQNSWNKYRKERSDRVILVNDKGAEFCFHFSNLEKGNRFAIPYDNDLRKKPRVILGKL